MPFHVIDLETDQPVTFGPPLGPICFETGAEAARFASVHSTNTGRKYKPRPIIDEDWQGRESRRMMDGTYMPLPWRDELWFMANATDDHYAHVSKDRNGMVAYTADAEKGSQDIQTRIKPGRYLKRFFGDVLTDEQIRELARTFSGKFEDNVLCLATTPDEIEEVYTTGPRSCMKAQASEYASSPIHPTRVYGAGDLAIAFMRRAAQITARSLVWPAKKVHCRIYGDEDRFRPLLTEADYTEKWSGFVGARLLRIAAPKHKGYLVIPCIDAEVGLRDKGDHLLMVGAGDGGNLSTRSTGGISGISWPLNTCDACGSGCDEEAAVYIEYREEYWCERCVDNYTFTCANCHTMMPTVDGAVNMHDRTRWCEDCFDNHGVTCDATGDRFDGREVALIGMADGEYWSPGHFEACGLHCKLCNENRRSGETCYQCAPELNLAGAAS
jgi:hypothetical protein